MIQLFVSEISKEEEKEIEKGLEEESTKEKGRLEKKQCNLLNKFRDFKIQNLLVENRIDVENLFLAAFAAFACFLSRCFVNVPIR